VLREDLRLTGTKIGCAEAECGICTVLVNSTPVVSIAQEGELHPLQQAFLDHGAVQCGICTPGLIMTAKGLLDRKAAMDEAVTEADIRAALKDSYCRCTGYQSIINAILQASGQDVPPYLPETRTPEREVGKPRPNPNALAKIKGTARFTDDYHFPGMLYARTKRAHVPPTCRTRAFVTLTRRRLEN
jgi:xanthine dehydrogenase molybdenum-binding subunit